MKMLYPIKLFDKQRRRAAYLDGLPPIEVLRNRQAKVNALPALCSSGRLQSHKGVISCPKDTLSPNEVNGMPSAEGATIRRGFQGRVVKRNL